MQAGACRVGRTRRPHTKYSTCRRSWLSKLWSSSSVAEAVCHGNWSRSDQIRLLATAHRCRQLGVLGPDTQSDDDFYLSYYYSMVHGSGQITRSVGMFPCVSVRDVTAVCRCQHRFIVIRSHFTTDLHETWHTYLGSQKEELSRFGPESENVFPFLPPKKKKLFWRPIMART